MWEGYCSLMLHWLCTDRDKVGRGQRRGQNLFYIFRSLQITELGLKIFELFIQLLKCYRLLGNITIDSVEFEVWTKWVPITKTKGAERKIFLNSSRDDILLFCRHEVARTHSSLWLESSSIIHPSCSIPTNMVKRLALRDPCSIVIITEKYFYYHFFPPQLESAEILKTADRWWDGISGWILMPRSDKADGVSLSKTF